MSIKPILFNTDMVRAIQSGHKTVTRRLLKLNLRENECSTIIVSDKDTGEFCYVEVLDEWENEVRRIYSPYSPGDILWVRETWGIIGEMDADEMEPGDCMFAYKADQCSLSPRWRPSIHMPREAARIFLHVTDVRVERLQDITEEGVFQEGISEEYADNIAEPDCEHTIYFPDMAPGPCWVCDPCKKCPYYFSYPELFGWFVWNETIKPADLPRYGWAANPWVWVIEFERCEKPEGWLST